jgi:predicted N-acyltransferase
MIKKERKKVEDYGLKILQKYGSELTSKDILRVYHLYLSTIDKKYSHPYLNETFFQLACDVLQENILFFLAYDEEEIMAMSMFYVGDDTLYGRYWGICPTKAKSYSYLHFEMCYYLGMQYCFEQGLSLFEAGAQGEQKLLRGFSPQVIYSAHQLKHQQLHTEIKRYISENNELIDREIEQLKSYLPFKNNLAF